MLITGVVGLITAVAKPINQLTQTGGEMTIGLKGIPSPTELIRPLPELQAAGAWLELPWDNNVFTLQVQELPWHLRLLTEMPAALVSLSTAAGALILWRLLGSASAGRPFDHRNPRRLTGLAVVVLAGGLGGPILDKFVRSAILAHLRLDGAESPLWDRATVDLTPIAWAMILLALAESFRRGRRLTEDTAGLV
jgi:hypothetical protein